MPTNWVLGGLKVRFGLIIRGINIWLTGNGLATTGLVGNLKVLNMGLVCSTLNARGGDGWIVVVCSLVSAATNVDLEGDGDDAATTSGCT